MTMDEFYKKFTQHSKNAIKQMLLKLNYDSK